MSDKPIAAGKSSYDLIDAELLFAEIDIQNVHLLVDIACGKGNYALAASSRVASGGTIVAVDLWQEFIVETGEIKALVDHNFLQVLPGIPYDCTDAEVSQVLHNLFEFHSVLSISRYILLENFVGSFGIGGVNAILFHENVTPSKARGLTSCS